LFIARVWTIGNRAANYELKSLPYSRKTARSSLVWFRSVSKRCGMKRMFFQSTVAHKCIEDHCADLKMKRKKSFIGSVRGVLRASSPFELTMPSNGCENVM
jgi:hypothetical protein